MARARSRARLRYTTITPAGEPERDAALVKTVTDENGLVTTYGYDVDQGFLTSAVKGDGSGAVVGGYDYRYGYDLMGNRVSETKAGVTTSAVFNDANQLTSRGSTSFTYDAAGNLLSSSAGAAYSYNARNQSTALQRPGGLNQTQKYAGASQFERVEKDQGAGSFTQFGESLLGMLIRKEGGATYYTRLPDGTLLSQRTPAGTHYYLYDGLGTVVGMTDDTGSVVARYTYDPYGQVLTESGPYNPWRFKGGYQSQTTLHYKFGHRWYDPSLGRWTQLDPLEQPTRSGDWNRYAYVAGDPVNAADPAGLFSIGSPFGAAKIGIGAVGVACAIGGIVAPGAGFVACGVIVATTSAILSSAQLAQSPSRRRGVGAAAAYAGWACSIAAAATPLRSAGGLAARSCSGAAALIGRTVGG